MSYHVALRLIACPTTRMFDSAAFAAVRNSSDETPPVSAADNVACTVTDGATRLHVKLTGERAGLRRTFECRDRLRSRYHAPEILAWIDGVCAKEGLRDVLLSDGLSWGTHRRASRLPPIIWDLRDAVADPERFVSFLHAAAEGI